MDDSFFMLSWMFFEGKRIIGWMAVTFLIGTRLHLEMLLLLPALTYAILYYFQQKYPKVEKWLRPPKIILAVCITMIGATLAYFFHFGAHRYIRADQYEIIKRIFLPIYNCRQPPFAYFLFSLNHISDCIQQILLTASPAALFVIGIGFIFKRRVKWLEPRIIFSLLGVFYFLIFNFTMYPMLTMPRDWDLFSLAATPIIFLAIALSQQLFTRLFEPSNHKMIVGMAAALGLFSFTFFYVNSSSESASRRLEGIGKWVFKSHHASSSYMLNVSAKMVDNLDEQIKRREGAIRDLLPYASNPDHEIGFLYYKLGVACYTNRQFNKAVENIQKSVEQDPDNASAIKSLAMIALQTWDFDEAYRMISFYNKNINYPKIVDPRGNEIEEYCNQMKNLVSSNVDSSIIQRKLDYIFQLTK